MNSISEECLVLKQKYDSCFNSWFKDRFLKGYRGDSCAGVFKEYQQCVKNAISEKGISLDALEEDVLGTSKERQPKGPPTNTT
ncbi:hypothetical protein NP493_1032g00031 [Ridgeia piscesae]|uniref:TP53-regulated inhibitor of apoptosis 1 n=1 Tax=Ridgeia piscesae TaxID=27915 RepID=A0AAD9NIX4_RIDPI|nr:hypothetical protein NP493_1032g00031 [Ridgeia piscesae]